jgi:hypothetical protein
MTTGESRNRIDDALLLSQSLRCSDTIIGLMVAGSFDPYDAPINSMLSDFLFKYSRVVHAKIVNSHSNNAYPELVSLATLCLAAKKCNELGAILPLMNGEDLASNLLTIKYSCAIDPFVASLALPFLDLAGRGILGISVRMGSVMKRLSHISWRFVTDNPILFQDKDLIKGNEKFLTNFLPVVDANICLLLTESNVPSGLNSKIISISWPTIQLLRSYFLVLTGKKLYEMDDVAWHVMLKLANTEDEIYNVLACFRDVADFKRQAYGIPYIKKHISVSANTLLDNMKRTFKPEHMNFVTEYCAYMHRNGMLKYHEINTLPHDWYKSDNKGHNMHSMLWYSMAIFVASVYKDYKPLLVWLEKYQYKKEQKGWNMDVMRAKFKASEVLGLGIDVKQHKVGKGVMYNFLKEGMVGPLVINT